MTRLPPLQTLQALRAVSALLVVVYHLVHAEAVHGGGVTLLGGPAHFGFAGVDVFFVISGFIMAIVTSGRFGDPAEAARFLTQRAVRILPLDWLFTLAIAVILALRPAALDPSLADKSLLQSLLLIPQAGGPLLVVGWTLTFELFFYAMTALALATGTARRVPLMIGGWATLLLMLQGVTADSPWGRLFSSPLSFEFMAGVMVGLFWHRLPAALAIPALASGVAWMIISGLLLLDVPGHGQTDGIRTLAFGLPAALIVLGAVRLETEQRVRMPKPLVMLGDASYSLYLSHVFVLSLAGRLGSGLGLTGSIAGNAVFLLGTLLGCCFVALVVHRWVERPLLDAGNRMVRTMLMRHRPA